MRKMVTVIFLLAMIPSLTAQQSASRAEATPGAESEIKTLELRLADLIIRGEWDEYAKQLASDYLHTRENGQVESKDEALASLRDVKRKIIVMEMEPADLAIRIHGDTAISNAKFTITVREAGQVKTRIIRETDVFVKRDGQWSLVTGQATTIGK